jgi:DNA-directed RNA polymerase specialized sigma24 family protein
VILEILADKHSDWIKMVRSFGADLPLAEDIVQEMYVRLHKYVDDPERIMYGEEVNTYFVYITLRNMYFSIKKAQAKIEYVDIELLEDSLVYEEPNVQELESFDNLIERIWGDVEDWHWYDKKLFEIYHNSPMSIRTIAEETKISARSIFNTLKNGRERIQTDCREEYEAWKASKESPGIR